MGRLKYEIDRRLLRNSRLSPQAYGFLDRFRLVRRALGRSRPLKSRALDAERSPFFIIGSGRSGNTLMRLLLVEGGEVTIPPESYFLPTLYRRFSVLRELPWDDLCRLLVDDLFSYPGFSHWKLDRASLLARLQALPHSRRTLADFIDQVYRTYGEASQSGFRRWGDKTPKNVAYLQQLDHVFPHARYIHMVRDGRDVVPSYVRAGIYDTPEEAARFWADAVDHALRFGRRVGPERYLEVRYERLVTEPAAELEKACAHLGIGYDPKMLDYWKHATRHGDTTESHHRNLQNPISPASVGKWRTALDVETLDRIMPVLRPGLERLGYPMNRHDPDEPS